MSYRSIALARLARSTQPMPTIPPARNTARGMEPEQKAKLLRGATLSQIAKKCGISITMVSYILNGQRRISAVTAVKMAEALKVPTNQLIAILSAAQGTGKNKKGKAGR